MNYYVILELTPGASDTDIKQAYRRLAMKYHPDRTDGDKAAEEKFKQVKEAYEKLSSGNYKYEPPQPSYKPTPSSQATNTGKNFSIIKGGVPDATISVTLKQVYSGVLARTSKMTICPECSGSGKYTQFAPGSIGETVWQYKHKYGHSSAKDKEANRCGSCKGLGEIVDFDCFFDIPAGVTDGMILRLECKDSYGRSNNKTKNIKIEVEERTYNQVRKEIVRKGLDLYSKISVTNKTLLEGGNQVFHSVDGKILEVKIPIAMEEGTMLKLKGCGLPDLQTGINGNLYLVLNGY